MNALRRPTTAALALVLMAGGAVAGAVAPSPPQAVARRSPPRIAARVSMDQAVMLAEHRYRARVVRAETRTEGDRTIYVLRMLDGAGRVFSVRVDAASGTIL
ncbi:MAG TPA: PepSY domain-containing protein [Steroidobacteraceae bacterium]|nr:PepSY domain-containing protein [Steroidobacteraceae bacterium]